MSSETNTQEIRTLAWNRNIIFVPRL